MYSMKSDTYEGGTIVYGESLEDSRCTRNHTNRFQDLCFGLNETQIHDWYSIVKHCNRISRDSCGERLLKGTSYRNGTSLSA